MRKLWEKRDIGRKYRLALLFLCSLLLIGGCAGDGGVSEAEAGSSGQAGALADGSGEETSRPAKEKLIGNQPMSNTVLYGTDFKITLRSAHYVYDREGMDEGAPLDFEVSVEYTGDEPEVQIWRGDPLVVMALEAEDPEIQKKLANMGVDGVLVADALAKGQATEISWTGKREFEEIGSIPKGNYHVRADVYFALDEGQTERVECHMELPFVID